MEKQQRWPWRKIKLFTLVVAITLSVAAKSPKQTFSI
jgi:hypothetical protein